MKKSFNIFPPVAIGAGEGTVTAAFVASGEETHPGRVLAVIETEKEILELKAGGKLKVVKAPSKGDKINKDTPVLAFEIDADAAQQNFGYHANQQIFPLTLLNIRKRGSIAEVDDILAIFKDGNGTEKIERATRAGRVVYALSQGDMVEAGKVFCAVQPLGPAQRMGAPSTLSYPLKVEKLAVERGEAVEKGAPLCVLQTADGKRVQIAAKTEGIVSLIAIHPEQILESPVEIFRIRREIDHLKDNEMKWNVRRKQTAAAAEDANAPPPAQGAVPPMKAGKTATVRRGPLVALGVVALAVLAVWAVRDVGLETIFEARIFETESDASQTSAVDESVRGQLVDLSTLSNGKQPVPTEAQQRAFKEYLQP